MTPDQAVRWLRTPAAIRTRCRQIFDAGRRGELAHFRIDLTRLDEAARLVADVAREAYPALDIPYHSRWRHFEAGGIDRWATIADGDPPARARRAVDLAMVSVLLDAGAGPQWKYDEAGRTYSRSEGLAVASFRMFVAGAFGAPCEVNASGLERLTVDALTRGFQVTAQNPLVGIEARVALLRALGTALRKQPALFGSDARPGFLIDHFTKSGSDVSLSVVLTTLLEALTIWPSGTMFQGVNVGDVGTHPAARSNDITNTYVPFHKLTQWLCYSLIEPLEWAGASITDQDALTGLPEYRNGGLFVDCGVLTRKTDQPGPFDPRSPVIVEWRALTVILLDLLADRVRAILGLDAKRLPLAKVLQGGSWSAGRKLAQERRGGAPPIDVATDGTTF